MVLSSSNSVWAEVQSSVATHKKCAKALSALRTKSSEAAFREELINCTNCVLLVYKRKPAVERLVRFLVSFVTSEAPDGAEEDSLLTFFLDYLVRHSECKDKAVRFRATQLIGLIMNDLSEDAELSEELFGSLQTAMLARCQDKVPLVRMHAAHSLHRLQTPTEEDDPVTCELLRLMASDTSADVRLVALKSIGLSRRTLTHFLRCARDVKAEIRTAAFSVIGSKLDAKWLTIAQRVTLLRDGLRDRHEGVRAACAEMLRTHWLRKADGQAAVVLASLDAEHHRELAGLVAIELLRDAPLPERLQGSRAWQAEAALLSLEEALLLRTRYEALSQERSASARAELDACLPDVPSFLAVLKAHSAQPLVLRELLATARLLELSDEAGRRLLGAHAAELLGSHEVVASPAGPGVVSSALDLLRAVHGVGASSERAFVREVAELISELHDPLEGAVPGDGDGGEAVASAQGVLRAQERSAEPEANEEPYAASARARAAEAADELADALARIGELKSQLASCVALEDVDAAAMIRRDIRELEAAIPAIESRGAPARPAAEANSHMLAALRLTEALLQRTTCDTRVPEISGLCAAIILPALQNSVDSLRALAVQCLGLTCVLGASHAARFLPLLEKVAQRDSAGAARCVALRALADIACTFSPAQLCAHEGGQEASSSLASGEEALEGCVQALCRAAVRDGGAAEEGTQAAGAQGVCKLLLLNRVPAQLRLACVSSALCALFAADSPLPLSAAKSADAAAGAGEDSAEVAGAMRQFVQLFISTFKGREQRAMLAQAIVPLARAASCAPRRTAWAELDLDRLLQFVAFYAGDSERARGTRDVARELFSHPDSAHAPALAKALGSAAFAPRDLAAAAAEHRERDAEGDGGFLQEAASLLRGLLGADSHLDKTSTRHVSKWLSALSRLGSAAAEAAEDEDGEDEVAACAGVGFVPVAKAIASAAGEASLGHDETTRLLLDLCSTLARQAANPSGALAAAAVPAAGKRAAGAASTKPKPARKLTKSTAAKSNGSGL